MTIPWFTESRAAADAWDTLVVAGENWPGVTSVSGPGLKRNIEEKQAKGDDAATIKDNGRKLGRVRFSSFMWKKEHWAELQRLFPMVEPNRDGGPRSPIEVYHPILALYGISTIYIYEMPILAHDKSMGTLVVTMNATRWAPGPKPVKTAAGSGGGGGAANCTSCANIDATIANLQNALTIALLAGDSEAIATLGDQINQQSAQKAACTCGQDVVNYDAQLIALSEELAAAVAAGDAEAMASIQALINQVLWAKSQTGADA